MSQFIDARFAGVEPYVPGEQPQAEKIIKLNTNECPYPPSAKVLAAAAEQAKKLNLYSDPAASVVTQRLAKTLGLSPAQVYCGNGSDEILAFCFLAFCPRGAAFADITYGFYPVYSRLFAVEAVTVPLREGFSLAVKDYTALGRTVFIANPNAPTGLALSRAQIETVLQNNPQNLVVVDEAYVDFGAESAVPLLSRYDNLLVVGTFSKSRQLAGGRFGYAAGSPVLIEGLNRIKFSFNPYNVNRMTQAAAAAALDDEDYFENCRQKVMATRGKTLEKLRALGFACTDSRANFVFASHPGIPAGELYEKLWEQKILVRWFDVPRIENYLRITIGTDQEMAALFAALQNILENHQ